jgi:hypothetical protein
MRIDDRLLERTLVFAGVELGGAVLTASTAQGSHGWLV